MAVNPTLVVERDSSNYAIAVSLRQFVAFISKSKMTSWIKNEKITRWRIELSCFSFDVVYLPGMENTVTDSRVCASVKGTEDHLQELCYPGITKMLHVVCSWNLLFSIKDVNITADNKQICPVFYKLKPGILVKATELLGFQMNLNFITRMS